MEDVITADHVSHDQDYELSRVSEPRDRNGLRQQLMHQEEEDNRELVRAAPTEGC